MYVTLSTDWNTACDVAPGVDVGLHVNVTTPEPAATATVGVAACPTAVMIADAIDGVLPAPFTAVTLNW